jgi:hypothetical protein
MADSNPFLFVHLPLNEVRGDRLLDDSANRRHALAHRSTMVADETFGACLELGGARGGYVEFPPWKLNPEVFLPPTLDRPRASDPLTLTFTIWISPAAEDGEWNLIDCGLRPELQRLKVRFKRLSGRVTFTFLAPAEPDKSRGFRWISQADMPPGQWIHFALVWDPRGSGATWGYGNCQMYLNGRFFSSSGKTDGETPFRMGGAAAFQTFLGWPSFRGKLAHFRVYTRELTQVEIVEAMNRDVARLGITDPVACSLLDPNGKPMMFLDASDIGEKMQVMVKPLKSGLMLENLFPGPPTPDQCHFELVFRPGTLDLTENRPISASTRDGYDRWEAQAYRRTRPDGHDSICIRCKFPRDLSSDLQIVLNALKADRRFGPRSTLMDIRYRSLKDAQDKAVTGRIQQWLQLAQRAPRRSLTMSVVQPSRGWTQDRSNRGTGPWIGGGRVFLMGHFICVDAKEQMKKDNWQLLMTIPSLYAPFGSQEMRFPGRVRWYSQAGSPVPKSLWWSDVIVAPGGAVSLGVDPPRQVLDAVDRIEVFLDGVSYSDEKIWIV